MGRAVAFLIVVALTIYLILRFASPQLLTPSETPKITQPTTTSAPPTVPILSSPPPVNTVPPSTQATPPQRPIETPRSTERRSYEEIEAQRAPFYATLRNNYQFIIMVRPAPDDQAILEIYLTVNDPYVNSELVQKEIAPNGTRNGFEKVRFFQPNPLGSTEPYRLDAEATVDSHGVWNTFRK